jgi:N-acetylneuraminic acid mutarotase
VFGGSDKSDWFNDLFIYDFDVHTWTKLSSSLPPIRDHTMLVCNDTELYLYGGKSKKGIESTLYRLKASTCNKEINR